MPHWRCAEGLTSSPGVGLAQDVANYHRTHGDLTRRVTIVSETGIAVPCEVQYDKGIEAPGEKQVLWWALNEEQQVLEAWTPKG